MSYKLTGLDEGDIVLIDNMPLHQYLWYINTKRHFNKELAVKYTKEIYNIDISNLLDGYHAYWEFNYNIFNEFNNTFTYTKEDDGSREYFNNYGRKVYEKFIKGYFYPEDDCLAPDWFRYNDIHHIFPLFYGGKSNIENLIHISKFHHDLLHENPKEDDRIQCYKALDYLGHLYEPNHINEIIKKYNLMQYKGGNDRLLAKIFKNCIEEEMFLFYEDNL